MQTFEPRSVGVPVHLLVVIQGLIGELKFADVCSRYKNKITEFLI